jgi:hypothetical protein
MLLSSIINLKRNFIFTKWVEYKNIADRKITSLLTQIILWFEHLSSQISLWFVLLLNKVKSFFLPKSSSSACISLSSSDPNYSILIYLCLVLLWISFRSLKSFWMFLTTPLFHGSFFYDFSSLISYFTIAEAIIELSLSILSSFSFSKLSEKF